MDVLDVDNLVNINGIVFDLDGTLIDTLPDILSALNRVMVSEGFRKINFQEARRLVGGGAQNLVEEAFATIGENKENPTIKSAFEKFIKYYEKEPAVKSTLFSNVEDFLQISHKNGIKLGICTNKPIGLTQLIIKEMKLINYFGDAVIGGDSLDVRKPNAIHLYETIKQMGTPISHTVMVGDSETDVKTARNAGVPIILVDFGYSILPPSQMGADAIISSFLELPAALMRINETKMSH